MSKRHGVQDSDLSYRTGENEGNQVYDRLRLEEDGWLVGIGIFAGGVGGNARARPSIYDGEGERNELIRALPQETWPNGRAWHYSGELGFVRMPNAKRFWAGFWRHKDDHATWGALDVPRTGPLAATHSVGTSQSDRPPPYRGVGVPFDGRLAVYVDYVPNLRPNVGTWRSPTPNGLTPDESPVFSGTLPHPEHAPGPDRVPTESTSTVQAVITRTDSGDTIHDRTFEADATDNARGYFEQELEGLALPAGVVCEAKFRHFDSWGVPAGWSEVRTVQRTPGPRQPTLTSPYGKLSALGGYSYQGTYSHPNGLSANALQIRVRNRTGRNILYDSGTILKAVADGAAWSHLEFHRDLKYGVEYTWEARLRDTSGSWGQWADLVHFHTNKSPDAPTRLQPSGGQVTSRSTLRCRVSDPEKDRITQVKFEVFNQTDNVAVAGSPFVASGGADGFANGSTVAVAASGLTLGKTYQFRAAADDDAGYGPWSGWAQFTYASAPNVVMAAPTEAGLVNLVRQPSAEYAGAAVYWEESNRTASDFVRLVVDEDSAVGTTCWEGAAGATSQNAHRSQMIPIDPARAVFLRGEFKRDVNSGPSNTILRLLCYDSVGTLLGTVDHGGSLGANGDTPTHWADKGGGIHPAGTTGFSNVLPVGTTQAKVEIVPSQKQAAVVRFDAVYLVQFVPPIPAVNMSLYDGWFGYFDGDTEGYGPPDESPRYQWVLEAQNSDSIGMPILTKPVTRIAIDYSSSSNTAKIQDRLLIHRWDGARYTMIHDSGWVNSAREVIPVPAGRIKNESRCLFSVQVKDANNVTGTSSPVEVDVRFDGPPELNILTIGGDPGRAELAITIDRSALPALSFGGIEVALVEDGVQRIVDRLFDQNTDRWTYPYPKSGMPYTVRVRQIEMVGGEEVHSRWSSEPVTVNYYPTYFIKSIDDPTGLIAPFEPVGDAIPGRKPVPPVTMFEPFDGEKPIHFVGTSRYSQGSMTIQLIDDWVPGFKAADLYRVLRRLEYDWPTVCILGHLSVEKFFAVFTEMEYGANELEEILATLSWQESSYSEDPYERAEGGVYEGARG